MFVNELLTVVRVPDSSKICQTLMGVINCGERHQEKRQSMRKSQGWRRHVIFTSLEQTSHEELGADEVG